MRLQTLHQANCRIAVAGFANNFNGGIVFEQTLEPTTYERVVIDEQDENRVGHVGVKSNRAAIGARIAVTVEGAACGRRTIHRTVGSGGSFGASPLQQHVGLGKSAQVVDVEIWWPTSNTRQRFAGVAKNQTIEIKEFAERYVTLERPRLHLDRSKTKTNDQARRR